MKKILTIFLICLSVTVYGQALNNTNTKFPNGLAAGNGITPKPTSGLTAGAIWYTTGTGFQYYNGSAWITLVPASRTLTINGTAQDLSVDRTFTVTTGSITGLQDSLTKKANRAFDNVAAGAIPISKLASSTISGVSLGGNLSNLSPGTGMSFTAYNGSAASTVNADTTTLQTVLNFFPKGDTRYYTKTAANANYIQNQTAVSQTAGFNISGNGSFGGIIKSTGAIGVSLPIPSLVTATPSTTGGTIVAGTYYYKVTAVDNYGETTASAEVSAATTGTTSSVALTWEEVSRAITYKIYKGTTSGEQNIYFSSSTANFTDIGAAGIAGTIPAINTAYAVKLNTNGIISGVQLVTQRKLNSYNVRYNNTLGVARWSEYLTDEETGSNAGSNFILYGHNDDGTGSTQSIKVVRSSGNLITSGSVTSTSFIKTDGTSLQFLKADGSVDANTYLTSASGVTTFSAGTTGLTPSAATSGAVTLAGTLAVANGGTGSGTQNFVDLTTNQTILGIKTLNSMPILGSSSGTNGQIIYANAAGTLKTITNFKYNDTTGVITTLIGNLGSNAYTSTAFAPLASPTFTGIVTAPTFSGELTGNAATVTTNANLTGPITSAGNATSIASQTGTGSTFAMSTAPSFTTNITTPLIIGGTAIGSNIIYKSTTGIGTATGIAHQWIGGTDGATVIATMLNNGNVGIGTTNPGSKFTVADAGNKKIFDYSASSVGTGYQYGTWTNTGASMLWGIESSVASTIFTGSTAYSSVWGTNNTTSMHFSPNNAVAMTIINGGNVGIGTTSPGYKLDVNGTGNFSGALTGTSATFSSNINTSGGSIYSKSSGTESNYQLNATTIGYDLTNGKGWITAGGPASRTTIDIYSANLTGTPTAPTASAGTNTTQVATTAFVQMANANTLSGTYTPAVTYDANTTANTIVDAHYMRIGSEVSVAGYIIVNNTVELTNSRIHISLPIASNFTNQANAGGVFTAFGLDANNYSLNADAATDNIDLQWVQNATGATRIQFSFTYTIL